MSPARLLIIDEHDTVREALEARLNAAAGLEVVGCTGCWETGLREAVSQKPDVVLLETKRTDGEGLDALRCLTEQCPSTSVVVLTSYPDAEEKEEALQMGAASYILKDIDTPQLVREIQAVAPAGSHSGL
jgi:DNA-binding NarL/FixJ family response regulator